MFNDARIRHEHCRTYRDCFAALLDNFILYRWSRNNQIEIEFTFKALTNNLDVQHAQKAKSKATPKTRRRFRFIHEGSIGKLEFPQGITKDIILFAILRIETSKY